MKRIVGSSRTAAVLSILLAACGASRHETIPSNAIRESQVLVIQETPDGSVTHFWRRAEAHELVLDEQAFSSEVNGRAVLPASRERDCHAEYLQCLKRCESSALPPGFDHIDRGGAAHSRFCRDQCRQPYLDCEELEELRARRGHRFISMDEALDWLKRHRKELLVGSVVVIAGVAFVVISAGAGVVIIAPAVLMASSAVPAQPRFVGGHHE